MSLTTRLSAFFLVTLALVLLGFSTLLYLLARLHLYHQVDERVEAAMATLLAAAEVSDEGLEWETQQRHLALGRDHGPDQVRWLVQDEHGQIVDRSSNLGKESFWNGDVFEANSSSLFTIHQDQTWRVLRSALLGPARRQRPASQRPEEKRSSHPGPVRHYARLVFTAGFSLAPVEASLRQLALASAAISLGLWLLAAFLGRWLSRQTLVPVISMARAARSIDAYALDQRLPDPGTHDELQDLAAAFNDLLSRLQEAFARQARFTGDASHQLRTPLTAILGEVEVALRRERSTEDLRAALHKVKGRAAHLGQIVEMLLFLARADPEAMTPHLEVVDLSAWLPGHLESWQSHSRYQDLRWVTAAGACSIKTQTPLLGQLLDNLLDNAFKYSPVGTPVTVQVAQEAGRVTMTVEDEGCGIPVQDLLHVFEPFFRSPRARRAGNPGVGLGLAVAQRIAVAFGGTIAAENRETKGSRIRVTMVPYTTAAGTTVEYRGASDGR